MNLAAFQLDDAGGGYGLVVGILAGLAAVFSILLYTPRRHLSVLRGFMSKRHWFNLHISLGIAAVALALPHASTKLHGLPGMVNLSMWVSILSGVAARFFAVRVAAATFRRECLLVQIAENVPKARREIDSLLPVALGQRVQTAIGEELDTNADTSFAALVAQFRKDLFVVLILQLAQLRIRGLDTQPSPGKPSSPEILRSFLILKRNIRLLRIQTESATFWTILHVALSIGFLILLVAHVAIVLLFKAKFDFL